MQNIQYEQLSKCIIYVQLSHNLRRKKDAKMEDQKDIMETGGTKSVMWSMERIPFVIISAFVATNVGITRPGQSHSMSVLSR